MSLWATVWHLSARVVDYVLVASLSLIPLQFSSVHDGLEGFSQSVALGERGPLYCDRRSVIKRRQLISVATVVLCFMVLEPEGGDELFASVLILWGFFLLYFTI